MPRLRHVLLSVVWATMPALLVGQGFGTSASEPRGTFVDRHGTELTSTQQSYHLSVIPVQVLDNSTVAAAISGVTRLPRDQVLQQIQSAAVPPGYPVRIINNIDRNLRDQIVPVMRREPGILVEEEARRSYPLNQSLSHVLGYLQLVDPVDVVSYSAFGIGPNDYLGVSGLERTYDDALRQGAAVSLTIDWAVQRMAEQSFTVSRGAAILMDARNGDVLAMVSRPTFDPNIFVSLSDEELERTLSTMSGSPLINRAIQATYPMGSNFKVVTALSGLEYDVIDRTHRVACGGRWQINANSRFFHCHHRGGHGRLGVEDALGKSCNVFFYDLADELGVDRLAATAQELGLGRATDVGLPFEKDGLIPDSIYRAERGSWYPGETVLLGIGQGPMSVTPLQVASVFQTIANEGVRYRPRLVTKVEGPYVNLDVEPQIVATVPLSDESMALLRSGLVKVTQPGGTGHSAFRGYRFGQVAGKTGTAEVASSSRIINHTWFSAFAPADNPRVVAVVLVEDGISGELTAAPQVRKLLDGFFNLGR